MSAAGDELAGLLRWYPAAWRERYGDELVALMQDVVGDRQPSFRFKVSVALGGLRERFHGVGLVGDQPPAERARSGSLLVLWAWTAFVVAGLSFSKLSEHYSYSLPPSLTGLPQGAFNSVVGLAVIGASLVALGALATVPALVRFIRTGGWTSIRGHVLRASALTMVTAAALVPLSLWAHHLDMRQRNGGDWVYSAAISLWALLVAVTLAQWTASGVAAVRRIDLSRRVLRFEASLAIGVAITMVLTTAAASLWWGAMAHDVPWFLQGTAPGTSPSPFPLQLVLTLALMLTAVLTAAYGVARIARSMGGLTPAPM